MERRRDKLAAWVLLILMTAAFGLSLLNIESDNALAALIEDGESRRERSAERRVQTDDAPDMLFTHALDPADSAD
jgi:hypothetical protein